MKGEERKVPERGEDEMVVVEEEEEEKSKFEG